MLEILKAAYDKPTTLTQNKHLFLVDRSKMATYRWDLYPLSPEYYHEFNPFFVHTIPTEFEMVLSGFKIFTVRDGFIAFADFLLKHWRDIPKWGNIWLVPESYAPLIPESLSGQFLTYFTSQIKKPELEKAKTVLIFSLLTDAYFENYEEIEKKIAPLKNLSPDVNFEICLSPRRNALLPPAPEENYHWLHVPEIIRNALPGRKIHWCQVQEFMGKSVLKDSYLLDIMYDQKFTCDSYLHYWNSMRGGVTNALPVWDPKKETLFDIDITFGQKLHVLPFPQVKSQFAELLYFQKTHSGELWTQSAFHNLVTRIVHGLKS